MQDIQARQRSQAQPLEEARQHYLQGLKLLKQRHLDDALRELSRAVKLQPLFPEALKALGLGFKARGEQGKALKFLNAAAIAWIRSGQLDKAEELFHHCQKCHAPISNPFLHLADTLLHKGKTDKACRFFEKALELTPEDSAVAAGYAKALAEAGRAEQARGFLQSYLQQYPQAEDVKRVQDEVPELQQDLQQEASSSPKQGDEVMTRSLQGDDDHDDHDDDGFEVEVEGKPVPVSRVPEPPVQQLVPEKKTDHSEKRRWPRIPLADYFLRFPKRKTLRPVVDISMEGVGFKLGDLPLRRGQNVQFDLMALEKVKIKKLRAVVRHVTHGHVGCEFVKLSGKQRKILEKVVTATEQAAAEEDLLISGKDTVNFDLEMW